MNSLIKSLNEASNKEEIIYTLAEYKSFIEDNIEQTLGGDDYIMSMYYIGTIIKA